MTEEHWKLAKMSTLLRYSFTFLLLLQLEGCHGQAGSSDGGANFFYYYSPTQRTMVNHGGALNSGNIFNNPFLQQQQQQVQAQPTLPPFRQQQQTALPNLQYSSPATSLLGYQQTHSAPGSIFTTQQPLGQLQYQQFGQQSLQNLVQPTAAFSGFTGFGQNLFANNAGFGQQAYLQPGAPTLAPQQQQQQQQNQNGGLSFFESPFQFIQNRYLQTPPTPSIPAPAPEQPLPATTVAPALQPEAVVTPTSAPRRKQKNSSRFRYVQAPQPTVQYQYNPYTRLVTPITSTLPFTEQRYYSTVVPSVPSPTGYSFSLGGGTQSTSSVHVNMGPLTNNIQQHLTEITQIRRVAGKRRKPVVYTDQLAVEHVVQDPVVGAGSMMMSHDTPMMESTSEQSSIAPEVPSPTPMVMSNLANMTSTMDTLLNEPSFQLETIASPAPVSTAAPIAEITPNAVDSDASAKINEANIPRRLAIRMKVARKRLQLTENPEEVNQGRSVDSAAVAVPTGRRRSGGRRRIPQNRLSGAEPAKEYEGPQKGVVEESSPVPVDVSTSTTPSPQAPPPAPVESSPPVEDSNQAVLEERPQVPEMEPVIASSTTTAQPLQSFSFEQDEIPEAMMPAHEAPAPVVENMEQDSPPDMQEPIPSAPVAPLTTTPSATTTTTTLAPEVIPEEEIKPMAPVESPAPMMMDDHPKHYDDYYEEYDDAQLGQQQEPKAIIVDQQAPALISEPSPNSDSGSSSSSSSSESDSAELPILEGAKKEDFPAVFGSQSNDADNSVETDRGEILTRHKSSKPVGESEGNNEAVAPPAVPTPSTTTTTTTEENIPQVQFIHNDPPEEHPPPTSEELEEPFFQLLSTTEQPLVMSTTVTSSQMLSTTASPVSSSEEMVDSFEDEHEQPPSSSTTESPVFEEKEPMVVATMPSSTESSQEDAIQSGQPQSVDDDQEISRPLPPSAPEMSDNRESDDLPSSSTMGTPIEVSSSTTEEMPIQLEDARDEVSPSSESSAVPSSSSTERPEQEMSSEDEKIASSSTTTTPLPSPATTEALEDSQEDFPQSSENLQEISAELPEESQSGEGEEKMTSDELIGKAQRLALEESLKRLRGRQQSTTEPVDDASQDDDNQNGTSSVEGQPKGKLKGFVRRPLQLANLTLPTSAPLPNVNAVLDDGEGEHQSRHQVIEKIQRFRATYRGRTTTKRPRRVTRPSSTERLPLPDLDSYSDSSSSTSGPVEYSSTSTPSRSRYSPIITTTERPSRFRTFLTSTTEAITTVEPTTTTTTTTTPAPDILTTTDYDHARTTTFPATTTPSTTTTSIDDFSENGDDDKLIAYNDEDDHVYYDEGHHDSTDPSSTTIASSTGRSEFMYTTPSTTTTTSSTEGPFMTTTDRIEPEEFSTESITFSTTTTDIPLATTTTAGQLIIHEILPTMPPLKEVSFVIGESVEEDQVIQSDEEEKHPPPPPSLEEHSQVRVETKVKVSSSVSGEDEPSDSSQQVSSYETSNESSPSSTPSSSSSSSLERTGSGRKIRVVVRRQRQRQVGQSVNATGRRMTPEQIRRRRKVVPRQLRRRS